MASPFGMGESLFAERDQQSLQSLWQSVQQSIGEKSIRNRRAKALRPTGKLSQQVERQSVRS